MVFKFQKIYRSRFNSSTESLGFSPIKPVGKRDAVSYVQNKAKHMKAGLNEKLANKVSQLGSTSGGTIWTKWPKTA